MIPVSVTAPGPADPALLDAPGAFLWWYLDLVDDHGDGLVLIAAFGLPFLPGLLDAARRGDPRPPREWPALSVAVYRGGSCAFYLLDVPGEAAWEQEAGAERIRLGRSTITVRPGALDVDLDAEGAGERITGTIAVRGPSPAWTDAPAAVHGWSVLTACAQGTSDLRWTGGSQSLAGRAYVDRNAGTRPIDALGMSAWTWARVAFPDRELVVWDVAGAAGEAQILAMELDPAGRRTWTPALLRTGSWWAGGCRTPRTLRVDGALLRLGAPFESSPFYARFPVIATDADGRIGRGFAERCVPTRIDAGWMRPLVSMVVQRPRERSMWLPLFAGPREGRVRRLLRSWVAA